MNNTMHSDNNPAMWENVAEECDDVFGSSANPIWRRVMLNFMWISCNSVAVWGVMVLVSIVNFPVLGAMASMSAFQAMHISFWPVWTASNPCALPNLHIPGDMFIHGTVALAISILQTQLWPIVSYCPRTWHNIFENQLPQNLTGMLCQSSHTCKKHSTFSGSKEQSHWKKHHKK